MLKGETDILKEFEKDWLDWTGLSPEDVRHVNIIKIRYYRRKTKEDAKKMRQIRKIMVRVAIQWVKSKKSSTKNLKLPSTI